VCIIGGCGLGATHHNQTRGNWFHLKWRRGIALRSDGLMGALDGHVPQDTQIAGDFGVVLSGRYLKVQSASGSRLTDSATLARYVYM
jgi:hypothetical protein